MRKFFLLFCLFSCLSWAVNIPMSFVHNQFGSSHRGLAIDSATGKYYVKEYHANGYVTVYDSVTQFASQISSSRINIAGGSYAGGTYIAALNNQVFARYDTSSNQGAVYRATDGTCLGSNTFAGMTGANNGFGWGGYTNINFFNDGNDIYVFGRNSSSTNYVLMKLDTQRSLKLKSGS